MNRLTVHRATVDDVLAIVALKKATWPDETAVQTLIATYLQSPHQTTHVASVNGTAAGFISCFATQSAVGVLRWEVDLLAVDPRFRQMGIGAKLVATAVAHGQKNGYRLARALIQIDNAASQRTFAHHQFHSQPSPLHLYLATKRATSNLTAVLPLAPTTHLIPVHTLNYSGLWVEGELSPVGLQAALAHHTQHQLDIVGVLIPAADSATQQAAQTLGFTYLAPYTFWERYL